MSFIDSIVDFGSSALKYLNANPIAGALAKTAVTGFALSQLQKSINKDNKKDNKEASITLDPDTQNAIPVVYGTAFVTPIVTDASISGDNLVMYYCLTLAEKTGTVYSTSSNSVISFDAVYWDELQVNFQSDGYTVASFSDSAGTVSTDPNGLIKIYPFSGGGNFPVSFTGQANGNTDLADVIMPDWTVNHTMNNLVFAIVRIEYNKDKGITNLGNLLFKLTNTMTLPGDCLYDYMTNTRYGAGISSTEINI